MSADFNIFGSFALLLSPDVKFLNTFQNDNYCFNKKYFVKFDKQRMANINKTQNIH